ncbi:hypothetical protein EVAR_52738_1 [Eumeta japonica]|uniref:Uncharacterized protein n=1 Tax=Eumeta variegata TaxID=151549 RepID=A0A4C1Y454_EUMVA|nr:hypothetical protein EVAR_52738_1 [Eumeta japonica]
MAGACGRGRARALVLALLVALPPPACRANHTQRYIIDLNLERSIIHPAPNPSWKTPSTELEQAGRLDSNSGRRLYPTSGYIVC